MSRFFTRRGRILTGPLKILQQAERRSPVPVTSLALTSAALSAGLLLMPQLSPPLSVDPTPMVEYVGVVHTEPESRPYARPDPIDAVATPAPAEPVAAGALAPSAQVASSTSEVSSEVSSAPPKKAAPKATQPVDRSPFQLDLLSALQTDGAEFDAAPAAAGVPQRAAPKSTSRRATTANRGAPVIAAGGSVQP